MFSNFKNFSIFLGLIIGFLIPSAIIIFIISDILTQVFKIDPNNALLYFSMIFGLSAIFSGLVTHKIIYKRDQVDKEINNGHIQDVEVKTSKTGAIIGGFVGIVLVVPPVIMSFTSGISENYFLFGFPVFHVVYISIFVFLGALTQRFYRRILFWVLMIPIIFFIIMIIKDSLS